jgi:hypothetical protein
MADYPGGATTAQTVTTNDVFIPELWSDDVIAAYKKNLIFANLVTKINHVGKKGDTINIPKPGRGSASAKVANTAVELIVDTATNLALSIDKHYEYSRMIEDIVDVQAIDSFRGFYTNDAGYALATQVDNDLWALAEEFQGGTAGGTGANLWETAVIGGDGSTLYTGDSSNDTALTDAGLRKMIQTLDDLDVPQTERVFVVPPVCRNVLMGLSRFTEQAFVGESGPSNTIRNGMIGDLYGIQVYVSSNAPSIDSAATRIGVLMHKDALCHIEQMSVRSQTSYKQEYLADLFTADTIYGVGTLRDTSGIAFAVPA